MVQADVDAFNQRSGSVARYAIPAISPEHAVFSADPWIFGLGPNLEPEDPMAAVRAAECTAPDPVSAFICRRASLGHPNAAGARAYALAIEKALGSLGVI